MLKGEAKSPPNPIDLSHISQVKSCQKAEMCERKKGGRSACQKLSSGLPSPFANRGSQEEATNFPEEICRPSNAFERQKGRQSGIEHAPGQEAFGQQTGNGNHSGSGFCFLFFCPKTLADRHNLISNSFLHFQCRKRLKCFDILSFSLTKFSNRTAFSSTLLTRAQKQCQSELCSIPLFANSKHFGRLPISSTINGKPGPRCQFY